MNIIINPGGDECWCNPRVEQTDGVPHVPRGTSADQNHKHLISHHSIKETKS